MNKPKIKRVKNKTQKRKGVTLNKVFTVSALVVLCLVIAAFTPFFRINNIIVEGNERIDVEYICKVSGISRGMNTFSIKLSDVKRNLLNEPYIHDVKIKRVFPNDIKMIISESAPAAVMPYAEGKFVLIDRYAKILEETSVENGEYPEITGVSVVVTEGHEIKAADKKFESRVEIIPQILNQLPECEVKDKVVEINLSDINNILFVLNGGKLEARLCGMEDFDYKLKMMSAIVKKLEDEGKTEGIIDFAGENPVYRPSDIIIDTEEDEE